MLAEFEPISGLLANTAGAVVVTGAFLAYLVKRLHHDTERERRQEQVMVAVAAQVARGEDACREHNERIAKQFAETVEGLTRQNNDTMVRVLDLARGRE